jgi:hypothetical protein
VLKPDDVLYFLHIPKTGGTSLMAWLNFLFAPDRVCPHVHLPAVKTDLARDPRRYDFFAGHFGLALLELLPVRPRLVTWLRDPVRRLLSTYHYFRELPEDTAHEFLIDAFARQQRQAALRLSFHDWVQLPQQEYAIHNIQPQFLSAGDCDESQMLPRALRTLALADHFGLTERMQDSVDLFCHRFVLPPRRFDLHLNQSKAHRQTAVPPATLRVIERRSQLACRMHRVAREIFDWRWQTMLQDLGLKDPADSAAGSGGPPSAARPSPTWRRRLHEKLEASYRLQRARVSAPLPGILPMSEVIHGTGWFQAVQLPGSNRWVRWTGPEPISVLYLNLPKAALLQVSWRALNVMDYEVITSCQLRVNGVFVPATVEQAPCDAFPLAARFSAVLTPSLLQREPGLVKLEFCINRTFPEPVASEPALGPKLLGFCTDAVEVQAI